MNNGFIIDLFVEDRAHESFLPPLIRRVAREEGKHADVRIRSAIGGQGRALNEYALHQKALMRGHLSMPDLLVVCIDANCMKFTKKRQTIYDATDLVLREKAVIACPDPHIERWLMTDPEVFAAVVGKPPRIRKGKCERDYYKRALARAVRDAGFPAPLSGIEFAQDLAEGMDLYAAGKSDNSLKSFLDDLRRSVRRF